ncbi:MAG: hypothetical protein H6581_19795 [Bacteroidia bacterium]|nr:hypothetical protein [Bacteroidia bacterium]
MQIILKTRVDCDFQTVFELFEEELFMALKPPGMRITLREFGGKKVGNIVSLEVKILGIIRQDWYNVITESQEGEEECFFVDEGRRMPFPIKKWRHKHRVIQAGTQTDIVDEVSFSTGTLLGDWLLRPVIWGQFVYRKPIYRRFFAESQRSTDHSPQ